MTRPYLYKIGELIEQLSITGRTLRYYDKIGLLPNSKRSDGDTRLFDENDIDLIKYIRTLLKKDNLSLEQIKHKLFSKTISNKNCIFFSDSFSYDQLQLSSDMPIFSFDQGDSESNILDNMRNFIKQFPNTRYFFSLHAHRRLDSCLYSLKKSIPKAVYFNYFSSSTLGYSIELIIEKISSLLQTPISIQELEMIIQRYLDQTFNLFICDSLKHFYSDFNDNSIPWSDSIGTLYPLFYSDTHSSRFINVVKNKKDAYKLLSSAFEKEFSINKRYVDSIRLYHSQSEQSAQLLEEKLLTLFPKLTITSNEKKMSPLFGASYLMISYI